MMNTVEIKKVILSDLVSLQEISLRTFLETFAEHNTAEDMQEYVDNNFSSAKLKDEIGDPDSLFYFAMLGNKVIGYLKLNFGQAQSELKDKRSVEIERIYVLKDFYGKKVGQVLFEKAMDIARKRNADYLWLGVWEKNPRAIHFYRKNGFVEFDKHIFRLGKDAQTDILMRLDLAGNEPG
jgi:ribosomal protein S18 acetylase RimI-like enzyme